MEKTTIEKLDEKVTTILQNYNQLKNENEAMRMELTTLKAEVELKNQQISKLEDENTMKELEVEEIVSKIEGILGKQ
jgi:chromosome segregation ATPase